MKLLTFIGLLITGLSFSQTRPEFYHRLESHLNSGEWDQLMALESEIDRYTVVVDTLSSDIHSVLGEAYLLTEKFDRSLAHYLSALHIREKLTPRETAGYSAVLYNLATVYLELGKFAPAKQTCERLLDVDAHLYGKKSVAYLESALFYTEALKASSEYAEAIRLLKRQLRHADDDYHRAVLLSGLGDLQSLQGHFEASAESINEAVRLLSDLKDTLHLELSRSVLGLNFIHEGKYPQAEYIFLRALDRLSATAGAEPHLNDVKSNLALTQIALNRSESALAIYRKLLTDDSLRFGIEHPAFATSLINIGAAYHDVGKLDSAIRSLERALEIIPKVYGAGSRAEADNLKNLANAYRDNGRPDLAIDTYKKAMILFADLEGSPGLTYASVVFERAKAELMQQSDRAEKWLLDALRLHKKHLGDTHPGYAEVNNYLGIYYWQKKDYKKARRYFGEAFFRFFEQIGLFFPALSEEEKTKFYFRQLKPVFEQYHSLAEEWYTTDPSVLEELYNYRLRTKGVIMMATERLKQNILGSGDSVLIDQYENWKRTKEQFTKRYANNDTKPHRIDSLKDLVNTLEKDLVVRSSDFARVYAADIPVWQQIRSKLREGERAVEMVRYRVFDPAGTGAFGDSIRYMALIIGPQSEIPKAVLMENGHLMEGQYLNHYRNAIRYQVSDTISYGAYWKPLAEVLKGSSKVFFSSDGVYHQLNLNALTNPVKGNFLIQEIELCEVTSTRDLLTRPGLPGSSSSDKYFFGFPQYRAEPQQIASEDSEYRAPRPPDETPGFSEIRGLRNGLLRFIRAGQGIVPLPGTRLEVETIARLHTNNDIRSEKLLEAAANESTLKALKSPEVLHIATHGYFLESNTFEGVGKRNHYYQNPLLRAGLIMAGAEDFLLKGTNFMDDEDGILTAYEAMNMDLRGTELVVLSACETGLGEVANGEGVYGLQRAFKVAGARHILMSLWNVDDTATQKLMALFYKSLIEGKDKYAAFREARLQLMTEYEEPYYWCSFKLLGD